MVLQFRKIHAAMSVEPAARWQTMEELERVADALAARMESNRISKARQAGGHVAARSMLDQVLRTNRVEYLDRDDCAAEDKVSLIKTLHRLNQFLGNYVRFVRILEPHVQRVLETTGRPARVLELASGAGELTLALAEAARRRGLAVEVTGSDIVPAYVTRGNEAAERRDLPVRFERLNAFDMSDVEPGRFDIIFIAQTIHHFSPGQLAMMIAQSTEVASSAFVAVDGYRSLRALGFLAAAGLTGSVLTRDLRFAHDAITSARKFYCESELAALAQLAAPMGAAQIRTIRPGHTLLEILGG